MKTRVIGQAGKHSAAMGRRNATSSAGLSLLTFAAFATAIVAGVAGVLSLVSSSGWAVPLLVVAGVLAAAGASTSSRAEKAKTQAARQQRGTASEEEVVTALRRAGVALVINGAELHAGGDADHVVAHLRTPFTGVLAVIETKSGGGHVRPQGRAILTGKAGRTIPGDPVRQVGRQASALARLTGQQVASIICVPGMSNEPFVVDSVVVCGTRHLASLFARDLPATALTASDVDAYATRILPKD